jgi:alkylhydroperoxidase family enzyme
MARIDYVDPAKASDRVNELIGKLNSSNIFRMMGHSERHFETYIRMGNAIRFKGSLDPVLRELAITRTGILCDAEYEVVAHKRIGKSVGVTDEKNAALEEGASSDAFNDLEKAVLRFTDDVVKNDRPGDDTFNPLAEQLNSEDLVELYLAIGFYIMTSKFLRTFDVDMQTG